MAKSASDKGKNKFTLLIYDLINIKSNDALELHSFAVGMGCGGRKDERRTSVDLKYNCYYRHHVHTYLYLVVLIFNSTDFTTEYKLREESVQEQQLQNELSIQGLYFFLIFCRLNNEYEIVIVNFNCV